MNKISHILLKIAWRIEKKGIEKLIAKEVDEQIYNELRTKTRKTSEGTEIQFRDLSHEEYLMVEAYKRKLAGASEYHTTQEILDNLKLNAGSE